MRFTTSLERGGKWLARYGKASSETTERARALARGPYPAESHIGAAILAPDPRDRLRGADMSVRDTQPTRLEVLFAALFSRTIVVLIFWTITIITCAQVMFRMSFIVGLAALVACALCYSGAAGFMGSLIARREKGYRGTDLLGIGTIGLLLVAAGSGLMVWSGFSMHAFDMKLAGVTWALLGAASAVVVVRKQDAL
jgi:hypothetical protein